MVITRISNYLHYMYLAKVFDKNLARVDALKLEFLKINQFLS